jgi:hypothetical protein
MENSWPGKTNPFIYSSISDRIHLRIWNGGRDRNHPDYGTAAYNEVFMNMMKEVVRNYGPFFEFWWDGADGEGPNGYCRVQSRTGGTPK